MYGGHHANVSILMSSILQLSHLSAQDVVVGNLFLILPVLTVN